MTSKLNTSGRLLTTLIFSFLFVFLFSGKLQAYDGDEQHETAVEEEHKEEKINMTAVAFEHILDSHSWHFWGEGEKAVSMPLPVILKTDDGFVSFSSGAFHHDVHGRHVVEKNGQRFVNFEETIYYASASPNEKGQYLEFRQEGNTTVVANDKPLDFSITKNAAQLMLTAVILLLLFTSIARAYKHTGITSAPKGKQSFFEPLITFVRDDIAKSNIGEKSDKFVPYLLTVFFLILINNVLGMLPIGANLTGNIAFTFVMACITLLVTNFNGNAYYWKHIFLPPVPKALYIMMIPLEIVGIFTKPFALMVRLFANMTAGHIIVISLIGLIFVFKTLWISPISVAFTLFIDVLECLVAVLQAYIFTLLTALFIGTACAEHHEEHAEGEHANH